MAPRRDPGTLAIGLVTWAVDRIGERTLPFLILFLLMCSVWILVSVRCYAQCRGDADLYRVMARWLTVAWAGTESATL